MNEWLMYRIRVILGIFHVLLNISMPEFPGMQVSGILSNDETLTFLSLIPPYPTPNREEVTGLFPALPSLSTRTEVRSIVLGRKLTPMDRLGKQDD